MIYINTARKMLTPEKLRLEFVNGIFSDEEITNNLGKH